MVALIDGDILIYRCACSAEHEEISVAKNRLDEILDRILFETKATSFKMYLTGINNFRKSIYPEYKANRTAPKPKHLQELRQYAVETMGAIIVDNIEADDMLAIEQITLRKQVGLL